MTTQQPTDEQFRTLALKALRILMRESKLRHLEVNPDNVINEAEQMAGISE